MAYTTLGNFGQTADRAGPNKRGGLPTKFSNDLVFNPDQPNIIYNVPFMIGRPQGLPAEYVPPTQAGMPMAVATWVWDPKKGAAPWPGLPGTDPSAVAAPVPMAYPAAIPGAIATTIPSYQQPAYQQQTYQQPVDQGGSSGLLLLLLLVAGGGAAFYFYTKKKKELMPMGMGPMPMEARRKRRRK